MSNEWDVRDEKYYTPAEVADLLSISRTTVKRYLLDGKLYGIKLSPRCWRIPESAYWEFLADARERALNASDHIPGSHPYREQIESKRALSED